MVRQKNSWKKIRFNYFVPSLIDISDNNANIRWDMKEFFEFILGHKHSDLNTAVPLGDEIADLEWNTVHFDEKMIYTIANSQKIGQKIFHLRKS